MNLVERFRSAIAPSTAEDLLPDRLARACVAVLPVDGAGLSVSLLPGHRLPLGASDSAAAAAERLQFTLGAGPCLSAQKARAMVVAATTEELREQWPVYAQQLAERTPFCSVLSLPVGGPLAGVVALDLYRAASGPLGEDVLRDVVEVAGAVGDALTGDLAGDEDMRLGLPAVLRTPGHRRPAPGVAGHRPARRVRGHDGQLGAGPAAGAGLPARPRRRDRGRPAAQRRDRGPRRLTRPATRPAQR